jgi:BioD-like phosphotransacetylase family protein
MTTILVTSTAEGTGKTAISVGLAQLARERDLAVGYMKPKGTRLRSAVGKTRDEDPLLAKELLDLDAELHELEPVVYSPTFVQEAIRGREQPADLRERISDEFEKLAADTDLMVLEGGGDCWTGGVVDLTDADVAELLDAQVVVVSPYTQPTDVDEILAAAEGFGDRLAGVLFNVVSEGDLDEIEQSIVPFLEGRGIQTLGSLPRDPSLAGVSVADLATTLGAELVAGEDGSELTLERFTVGAMGSETALDHFRRLRNAAVVTGGDRPDVQTAALQAPGVNCLILTGGYRPPSAVLGKAEEQGVPVLLLQTDTRSTVDRVEDALSTGPTRSRATVDRMTELLREGVDLDRIFGAD